MKKEIKYRYIIDSQNRLVIKRNKKSLLTNGRFRIDKDNRLIYWLNEPKNWKRKYDLPSKIIFTGNWELNPNYDLQVNLDETKDQYKDAHLIFKGEIISTDRDTLVFEVISQNKRGLSHLQLLKLSGFWQADEFNRIYFSAKRKIGLPDFLTLEGNWQINDQQQIIYKYEKINLKTKTKISQVLLFECFWQINNRSRLTYILLQSSESRFDFRVQIEAPNLYPQKGVIKYRLGIGMREQKFSLMKIICLYGIWKFSRKAGLIFQMDYGRKAVRNIEFGTNIYLTKRDAITFSLTNKRKEPLGFNMTFTHRFLKKLDAKTFLRLKASGGKAFVETGAQVPF